MPSSDTSASLIRVLLIVICITLNILMLCHVSYADWFLLSSNPNNNTEFFIDLDNVRPVSKDVLRVWAKRVYYQDEAHSNHIKEVKAYEEISCSELKIRTLQLTNYLYSGDIVRREVDSKWWYPSYESLGYAEIYYSCQQLNK